ncbi:MAG TPA: hypothetical protein PKV27_06350 [Ilumatobacteraceae bacterium]|nr:hypothetical protein [Ilumatobacteraceae bacterium]
MKQRTPRNFQLRRLAIGALALSSLTLAACSDDTKNDAKSAVSNAVEDVKEAGSDAINSAAEAAVRNIATQQGEEQFKNSGNELDGPLTCTAKVDANAKNVAVDCTGKTKDGKAAALKGTTSELPGASITELEGDFKGTVDGTEVFATKALGGS